MVYKGQKPTIEVNVNTTATATTIQPNVPWMASVANKNTSKIDNITRAILSREPMLLFIIL
jgi:hypothetical protein